MVDDAGLGEGAHVRRGVDEEDVEILQDEVEGRVLGRAEDLRHRRAEQLYADADRRLEVADRRQRVGREPHPGRILGAGEKADLEIGRQVGPHPKAAMRHPVRLQEDRAQGRALTPRDAATLHHGHEHLHQRSDRVGTAIHRGGGCVLARASSRLRDASSWLCPLGRRPSRRRSTAQP